MDVDNDWVMEWPRQLTAAHVDRISIAIHAGRLVDLSAMDARSKRSLQRRTFCKLMVVWIFGCLVWLGDDQAG